MTGARRIDLDEPRSVGELIGAAASLYGAYPLLFAVMALAVIAPFDLALLAATGHGPLHRGGEPAGTFIIVELLRLALIGPLISALHLHAVELVGRGERPRLRAVAANGLKVLPVVAAASIVSGIGIAAGFVALILPGLYLALRWAVVAQAAAAERRGWTDALSRSSELTRTHFGHVFAIVLISGLFAELVHVAAGAVDASSTAPAAVALGILADTLTASFAALTLALLYFDLAARPGGSRMAPREHPQLRDLD